MKTDSVDGGVAVRVWRGRRARVCQHAQGTTMKALFLLAATLAASTAGAAVTPAPSTFRIGGVDFALPLPTGYCVPQGKQIDIAQLIAAADPNSVTHLTLMKCGVEITTGANDYTLIKTPKTALVAAVDRPTLLASLGAEFDKPETLKYLQSDAFDKKVSEDAGKVIPGKPQFTGDIKPLGRDDVCAYLGGTTKVVGNGASYSQAVGTCITSIGKRVVVVNRYGIRADEAGVAILLRQAKALALTIKTSSPS